ncbi:U3 snoRNP protein [Malassezia sp. CBS 17886]|nr:U3 snoRNP protein [Malassezia sp. CBS 17886]
MERVQYSLERSLPQLRLLDEQSILSKPELRSITNQRQAFEARLIRRKAVKQDFVQYLDFEDDLNALVQLRARKRASEASAHAKAHGDDGQARHLPRNFFSKMAAGYSAQCIGIFERLVRKFRWDVDCWMRYLAWAKRRKMRVVAGRVYARALALHPTDVALWISAADYELNANADTTAARALLQRAIRMNPLVDVDAMSAEHLFAAARAKKVRRTGPHVRATRGPGVLRWDLSAYEQDVLRLWAEYFRMELVFMERLRRRWRVLGVQGDEAVGNAPTAGAAHGDAFANERAAAHGVAPGGPAEETRAPQTRTEDREDVGDDIAAAAEAAVEADVPGAGAQDDDADEEGDSMDEGSGARLAAAPGTTAPPGHQQIMHGSIPLAVLASAQRALPRSLQFLLYVGLLQLLGAFPFLDSVVVRPHGEVISLRDASGPRLGAGDRLRNGLIHGVLDAVHSTSRHWGDDGRVAACALSCLQPLLHPFSHPVYTELELSALPAPAADEELDTNRLLHGASQLHAAGAPIDKLHALASIPVELRDAAVAGGAYDPWHACRAVLLLLRVVSLRLVGADDTRRKGMSTLLQMLADSGDLPLVARAVVVAYRERIGGADAPGSGLSLSFLATLRCLANATRSGITETNLVQYFDRAAEKLVDALLRASPGELSWLAVERLARHAGETERVDRGTHAGDQNAERGLAEAAHALAAEAPREPGAWVLYERITRRLAREDLISAPPIAFAWSSLNSAGADTAQAAWLRMLSSCSSVADVASEAAAPVWASLIQYMGVSASSATGAALVVPSSARRALWMDFLAWVENAGAVPVPPGDRKLARRAGRWAWSLYEDAVQRSGALLASSQLVGTARTQAQALHDAVVVRFFRFASSPSALQDATSPTPAAGKDRALQYAFQRGTVSSATWTALADMEAEEGDAVDGDARAVDARRMRTVKLYERALGQNERGGSPETTTEVWLQYLAYLAKRDMPAALVQLQRATERVRPLGPAAVAALQRGWQQLVEP